MPGIARRLPARRPPPAGPSTPPCRPSRSRSRTGGIGETGRRQHRDDALHIRDRRRGVVARQGHLRRLARGAARGSRPVDRDAQARSVHQRRSGHDEPVPARRGVRHPRRCRDRSRSRSLRALRAHQDEPGQQLHDRPRLRDGHLERAPWRLPRRDGAGHPAHHRRDSPPRRRRRRRGGRRPRRDRRHGRRHRVAAVLRGDPPDGRRAPSRAHAVPAPDPRCLTSRAPGR